MNIDERLEALTQRLEALTRNLELLVRMQQENDRQLNRLGKYIRAVSNLVLDHEIRIRTLEKDDSEDSAKN